MFLDRGAMPGGTNVEFKLDSEVGDELAAPGTRNWYRGLKRGIDVVAALFMLILAAPVVLLAGMLIKLTSRGPIFYSQTRLGLAGKPFPIYKLRSMQHNCERFSGPRWATPRDARVTPFGRFLRRTHIDELPQLWNVVRGDMSLVGPRPERPELIPALEREISGYRKRLEVRPGVTGLAQLQLPPDTDLESVRRKLVYDVHYVRGLSLKMDIGILLGTPCYLIGIPFSLTGRIFGIAGAREIEVLDTALPARRERTSPQPAAAGAR